LCRSWIILSRNTPGTCERCPSWPPLFVWITSSECRRTKEFTNPRVDLILNWEVQ
jgi:hypothetical protein